MIKVVNKKTYKGNGHYIGRPSPLGNPFRIGPDGDRNQTIEKYRRWLWKQIKEGTDKELRRLAAIARNSDLTLICWCAPLACHGDVIKRAIEWLNETNKGKTNEHKQM